MNIGCKGSRSFSIYCLTALLKKQKVVAKLREIANSIGREMEVLNVLEKMFLLRE